MPGKARKGMGFKAAAKATGLPPDQAKKVIAAGARNASPAAKKANPNLKKVLPAKKAAAPSKRQRGAVASKRQRAAGGGY